MSEAARTSAGVPDAARPDRIELTGLRARGRHGLFAAETELGQVFVVDLVVETDLERAGRTGDLTDTLDYGRIATSVHDLVTGPPVALIETLAARIADAVLSDPKATAVEVAVHKPQAPIPVPFDDVVVRVRRLRSTP